MSALVSALGWALLHFLWQGLLVGALAALALMLLRNAAPQLRYAIACTALGLCLVLPVATMVAVGDRAAPTDVADAMSRADTVSSPKAGAVALPALPSQWRQPVQAQLPLIVALWSLGAALLALRMALGLAWIARADRPGNGRRDPAWQARLDALAARFALPRQVALRVVDGIDGPMAARVFRPVVLVPAALLARMPPDLLEALLAHELAHIKRHDYLVNLAQSAIEALLFYHPVVWWLSRRIRIERELVADDLAARALGDPRRLARALDHLSEFNAPAPHLAPAAHGGNLMSRIQRLVRPRRHALDWRLALPILGLSVACVSVFAQGTPPAEARTQAVATASVEDTRRDGSEFMLVGPDNSGPSFLSADYDQVKNVPALRARYGDQFLWFRRDGRAYVVRDAALVAQAREAWAPTEPVGKEMEALGAQMEVHGERMEGIGKRMEDATAGSAPIEAEMDRLGKQMEQLGERIEPLAEQMATADNDTQREQLQSQMDELSSQMSRLSDRMQAQSAELERLHAPLNALGAEMERAGEPMKPLGARMDVLGAQMEKLSEQASRRTYALIDQALREGKAIAVDGAAKK
ncbi:M56 family metallopeptidase [Arenimonas sp. MALMAid1274]|uniref:M56 family metallopeptidase n=1 Tax=Arenimonas sp. MALMAid1274 TaxID=3411630 RepID=UPI003BA3ABB7